MMKTELLIPKWYAAAAMCLSLIPSTVGYAQRPAVESTDTATASRTQDRDSQLLEGLDTMKPAGGSAAPTKADSQNASTGSRPDGVIDPFSAGSDVGQQNPLARISSHMRHVEGLLSKRIVSGETLQSQRQIVDQLDKLIAALAGSQQSKKQRQPGSPSTSKTSSQAKGKEAADTGGVPRDSGEGVQLPTVMKSGGTEVWGHLPERYRQQLRSAEAIEFLPKYRKLIEDYFTRLAEDRGFQQ